ncbi:MAG TPA: hypothetical protein VKU85_11200, partial [bacterium]|nr:hypothetical protein [bacterium]
MTKTQAGIIAMSGALALATVAPVLAGDKNPYAQPDDSWISLSGTVTDARADSFRLDYGDGVITVEMDDWDSYGDAYGLMDGDNVTVYGAIDDDLFETTTIEASSVYVESLNTYFYASAADEEGGFDHVYWPVVDPIVVSSLSLRGQVTEVDESAREFTVDTN